MGTTIHAHIEVKRNGRWLHFGAPNVKTDCLVFAAINGEGLGYMRESARERIYPKASVVGLPSDISEVTQHCYLQNAANMHLHGEGALTSDDLYALQEHLKEINDNYCKRYDLEEDIFNTYINGNCIASHEGWDDARIVFWYDH